MTKLKATPNLYFPVPSTISNGWEIGKGFDPVNGIPLSETGFDAVPSNLEINEYDIQSGTKDEFTVYDSESYSVAMSAHEKVHGSGWGTTVNEEVNAETSANYKATSFTISSLSTALGQEKSVLMNSQTLDEGPKKYLVENGYEAFCEHYGTHFICGLTLGSASELHFNLNFKEVSSQAAFSASFNEKVSEFGVSEKTSEEISASMEASQTTYVSSKQHNRYGFTPITDYNSVDDIPVIQQEFIDSLNKGTNDLQLIQVMVAPWSSLYDVFSEIQSEMATSSLGLNSDLGAAYAKYNYVFQSTSHIYDSGLYIGNTQFQRLQDIKFQSSAAMQSIRDLCSDAAKNGIAISQDDISKYQTDGADMVDLFNLESGRFAISWQVILKKETEWGWDYEPKWKNIDGTNPDRQVSQTDGIETETLQGLGYAYWPRDNNTAFWIQPIDNMGHDILNTPALNVFRDGTFQIYLFYKESNNQVYTETSDMIPINGNKNEKLVVELDNEFDHKLYVKDSNWKGHKGTNSKGGTIYYGQGGIFQVVPC